jgi:hypothetical protein
VADDINLVPGRECGDCMACCVDLTISFDQMKKPAGVRCAHRLANGCNIYATRPNVCRSFHCLWRRLPNMDESWRPDLSGILMILGDVPPESDARVAVELILIGQPDILESDRFVGMIAGFIENGTATYLTVPRGSGFLHTHLLMNERLAPAIAARNLPTMKAWLRSAYDDIMDMTPVPVS